MHKQLLQSHARNAQTQREKSLEKVYEILKEREKEIQRKDNRRRETETAASTVRKPNKRRCCACGKLGHIAK